MKNFTDFTIDIAKNPELGNECLTKLNEVDYIGLSAWLNSKGYFVDETKCREILKNKEDIKLSTAVGFAY